MVADAQEILEFLGCPPGPAGMRHLNRLVRAYVRKVPWESAFRIAKRQVTPETSRCPRWPDEFWQDALTLGGGGTCFESNYAFFQLLQALGYSGYLTINDMEEQRSCHSAIVIDLKGRKILVDVGIPLHAALPIEAGLVTRTGAWLHTYSVRPKGVDRYQIERSRHPKHTIYTLLDRPVPEPDYRQAVENDYGENGLFLNRVILVKVIGDRLWRFNSQEIPYRLEAFTRQTREEQPVPPEQVVATLARLFQMDAAKIEMALEAVSR